MNKQRIPEPRHQREDPLTSLVGQLFNTKIKLLTIMMLVLVIVVAAVRKDRFFVIAFFGLLTFLVLVELSFAVSSRSRSGVAEASIHDLLKPSLSTESSAGPFPKYIPGLAAMLSFTTLAALFMLVLVKIATEETMTAGHEVLSPATQEPPAVFTTTPTPYVIPSAPKPTPRADAPILTIQSVELQGMDPKSHSILYQVEAGENPWCLAEKFYTEGRHFVTICKYNNLWDEAAQRCIELSTGSVLQIPQAAEMPNVGLPDPMPTPGTRYIDYFCSPEDELRFLPAR